MNDLTVVIAKRTLKIMLVFTGLIFLGLVENWDAKGIYVGLAVLIHVHAIGLLIWTAIVAIVVSIYSVVQLRKKKG